MQAYLSLIFELDRQFRCDGGRPVGDSPELCRALDAFGFADLNAAYLYFAAVSSVYSWNDPRRFKTGTPAEVLSSLRRSWEVAPSSSRIVEDISNLATVLAAIIAADGAKVHDLFHRSGCRADPKRDDGHLLKHKPRQRQRKDTLEAKPLHPDCQEAYDMIMEGSCQGSIYAHGLEAGAAKHAEDTAGDEADTAEFSNDDDEEVQVVWLVDDACEVCMRAHLHPCDHT